MDITYSTQMLGTVFFVIILAFLVYKGFMTRSVKYYKASGILLAVGFIITYVWNPVKVVSPPIENYEALYKVDIVVPDKVVVEVDTLEDKQVELENKLKEEK